MEKNRVLLEERIGWRWGFFRMIKWKRRWEGEGVEQNEISETPEGE
jgi:hypothetical protein